MSTLLSESGEDMDPRLACPTCKGEKLVPVRGCACSMRCYCGPTWIDCPDCEHGRGPCGICGDEATVVRADEIYCENCDPEAEPADGAFPSLGGGLREQIEQAHAMERWDRHPAW